MAAAVHVLIPKEGCLRVGTQERLVSKVAGGPPPGVVLVDPCPGREGQSRGRTRGSAGVRHPVWPRG